jgi:hypothetical protein
LSKSSRILDTAKRQKFSGNKLNLLALYLYIIVNLSKATEAACLFLERDGGQMNIMKLVKLMYLLDRLSLDQRNAPISGGDYLSMRNSAPPDMSQPRAAPPRFILTCWRD